MPRGGLAAPRQLKEQVEKALQESRKARSRANKAADQAYRQFERTLRSMFAGLLETQALVQSILDSSTHYSIIGKDLHRRIVFWNEGARRNYGYEAHEILGRNSDVLHDVSDLESGIVEKLHREALRRGKAEGRFLRVRKDGTRFVASVVVTRRVDAAGKPIGYLIISRDVTKEMEVERAREAVLSREAQLLGEQNQFKTEFVNMAAHELLTPLTPIRALLSLVESHGKVAGDAELARHFEVIQRNFERLNRLVEDLLSASRMELGKLQLRLEDVDVGRLVQAIAEAFAPAARRRGIALKAQRSEVPAVRGDPDRLSQVVFNLLSNALKFTPDGGTIKVSTRLRADHVEVVVQDTGAGIDARFRKHLFKPFSRAQAHAADFPGGTGLGLYVSKGIVELHQGTLEAASPGAGRGTRMTVRLPTKESLVPAVATPDAAPTRRPRRARAG